MTERREYDNWGYQVTERLIFRDESGMRNRDGEINEKRKESLYMQKCNVRND